MTTTTNATNANEALVVAGILYEVPGENVSFGQGLAQRAFISQGN